MKANLSHCRRDAFRSSLVGRFLALRNQGSRVIFREEILGTCLAHDYGRLKFMKRKKAMKLLRRFQPQPTEQVQKFRAVIAGELGVNPELLVFCTAVGSALQEKHNLDGWWEYEGLVVTMKMVPDRSKTPKDIRVVVTPSDVDAGYRKPGQQIAKLFEFARKTLGLKSGVI